MSHPLYVFDMDETLIQGDCTMMWHEFLVEQGVITDTDFIKEDKRLMALYAQGEMEIKEYLDFSIAPLSHLTKQQISSLADQCVELKVLPKLFPQALELIEHLNKQQQSMLVISASMAFLVEAIAKKIGIQHAIGIDLVEQNNRLTPEIDGVASYQQGKVTRLQQWINNNAKNITFSPLHFYTDSINDLPLCLYADLVYLINPCEKLLQQSKNKPWKIFNWKI